MQKPDAEGFVTINWPSKNIPHGGIFHTPIANPTEKQQELLKIQLEESKLILEQNQKKALALREKNEKKPEQPVVRRPTIRPRTSRRRSLSEIRESGIFDFDRYCPLKRGEDRELMKERLANLMTYGDSDDQPKPKLPPTKKEIKLPTNKDKWNDLVTQIRERTEWLAEMEYLGQGAAHRDTIKDQIAERMRALDELGIDSECSSARTSKSGFSTLRSFENVRNSASDRTMEKNGGAAAKKTGSAAAVQKIGSATSSAQTSVRSDKSKKKQSVRSSVRPAAVKDENVTAYAQLSPLQRSPRRRQ